MKSFQDPIVAVVIGSNRGIGLALVRQLLVNPMVDVVYAGCRDPGFACDLDDLVKTYGTRVVPIAVDVTNSESKPGLTREHHLHKYKLHTNVIFKQRPTDIHALRRVS